MFILRLFIALALPACCITGASPATAQTPPMTRPAANKTSGQHPMVFYIAHGGKDACGLGCSEWIAAEGEIVPSTGNQLQRLLVQLSGARLPIFLNSPGGSVMTSIALGRLIRARQFTVSVGHTVPLDCNFETTDENSCEARMSTGQPIEAEIDPSTARCDSACVFVFAAGTVRLIPPEVRLGIHDLGLDPSHPNWPTEFFDAMERSTKARLHEYMRFMGIDDQLLSRTFAIPNASLEHLSRDDAARFGLDRREFAESPWRFFNMPAPAVRKSFFLHIQSEQSRYIDGLVEVSCGKAPGARYVLTFARDPLPTDPSALSVQAPVNIRVGDKQFSLARDDDPKFYRRSAQLAPAVLDGVADAATIALPRTEFGGEAGAAGDITLTMDRFSTAYATLRKVCTLPENALSH